MKFSKIINYSKNEIKSFIEDNKNGVIIIRGTTATGKSKLSISLNDFFNLEIISSDSRQIYKYMDIGTDKIPTKIRKKIPHHQIDIINPNQNYTAGQRKKNTEIIINQIIKKNKIPFIVGGTGLYIDTIYKNFNLPECPPDEELRENLYSQEDKQPGTLRNILNEIDPIQAEKIHPNSTRYLVRALEIYYTTGKPKSYYQGINKPKYPILMLGLIRKKEDTEKLIKNRIKQMIKIGLEDEVKKLLEMGYNKDLQSMQGIGYKETIKYLEGQSTKEERIDEIIKNTCHLAKKQRTRFRRYITDSKNKHIPNIKYLNIQID